MKNLLRLIQSTMELRAYYVAIALCSIALSAATLTTPFLISAAVGHVERIVGQTQDRDVTPVVWLAIWLLVAQLVAAVVQNIGGYFGDVMAARLRVLLSARYYDKLLRLPQTYFDNNRTGAITSKLNRSITELTQFAQQMANTFLSMILTTVVVLVVTAWYSVALSALLVVLFPTYLYLTALTSRNWQKFEHAKNTDIDAASGRFQEVIAAVPVVRSFVAERRELRFFRERFERTVGVTRQQSRHWHRMDTLRRAVLALIFFGIYVILFTQTANGTFSIADMVLLIQLVARIQTPVEMMSWVVDVAQRATTGSASYFAVLDTEESRDAESLADADPHTAAAEIVAGADPSAPVIACESVCFAYPDGPQVVHNVSFDLARGQQLALVSESGGGKSTLVALLLGLHTPTAGVIRLFGHDAAALPMPVRRALIGVVFQDAHLFSGTIAENIVYARPDAGEHHMREAARRASADAFISGFDHGYDTLIGERGLKLSGGQKQRIAVARAMIKDAPILVLDEATSALDTKSERAVQAGLDELARMRTSVVIAHRLSTISAVDQIVCLEAGRVVEHGSPEELAATGGIYAELLALQASASAADRERLKRFGLLG